MFAQDVPRLPVQELSRPGASELVRCQVCDRTFKAERIAKHQAICEKVRAVSRPTFKSEMQRAYLAGGSNGVLLGYGQHHEVARSREYSPPVGVWALPWRQRRDLWQLDSSSAELRRLQRRDIAPEDYELLLRLDEAIAPRPGTVLNETECENMLPSAKLKMCPLTDMCAVCQCELQDEEDLRVLPGCGHVFHAQCIVKWLSTSKAVCPLDGIEVRLGSSPRE
jgi:hypothetical protein